VVKPLPSKREVLSLSISTAKKRNENCISVGTGFRVGLGVLQGKKKKRTVPDNQLLFLTKKGKCSQFAMAVLTVGDTFAAIRPRLLV
jgi:hypothetical protein